MNRALVRIAVGLGLVAMTSCAPSTHVQRRIDPNYSGEPKRMLIVYEIYPWERGFSAAELHERISQELARCGIASASISRERAYGQRKPEDDQKFFADADTIKGFGEDSILAIKEKSAWYWRSSGDNVSTDYEVKFVDRSKKAIVWSANVHLSTLNSFRVTPQEKAETFARDIASYLVKDGIIRTCPPRSPAR